MPSIGTEINSDVNIFILGRPEQTFSQPHAVIFSFSAKSKNRVNGENSYANLN